MCAASLPEPCTARADVCPVNHRCDASAVSRDSNGCVPRSCTRDSECDVGECINRICSERAGACANGMAPVAPPARYTPPVEPPVNSSSEMDAGSADAGQHDEHRALLCHEDSDCAAVPGGWCVGTADRRKCGGMPADECTSDGQCAQSGAGKFCVATQPCGQWVCTPELPKTCVEDKSVCGPNQRCDRRQAAVRGSTGCVALKCVQDSDCYVGGCVNHVCSDEPGTCASGRPPPTPIDSKVIREQTGDPDSICPEGLRACWHGNGTRYCAQTCNRQEP